jgi:hypothetical protein
MTTFASTFASTARDAGVTAAKTGLGDVRAMLGDDAPADVVQRALEWHIQCLLDAGVTLICDDSGGSLDSVEVCRKRVLADDAGVMFSTCAPRPTRVGIINTSRITGPDMARGPLPPV